MHAQAEKSKEIKSRVIANSVAQKKGNGKQGVNFVDNRPEAIAPRKLQEMADNSLQVKQAAQQQQSPQKKESKTGLHNNLKTGIENLSGYSMDELKVHYNSDKPAQLQSHTYAQGTDIHLASGQEKHLPHEAWHVVQQKQGRVKPTRQMNAIVNVKDDDGLEKEADVMGAKALQTTNGTIGQGGESQFRKSKNTETAGDGIFQMKRVTDAVLNVAGEDHDESEPFRGTEKAYSLAKAKGEYWQELEFSHKGELGDPTELRLIHYLKMMNEHSTKFQTLISGLNEKQFVENIKPVIHHLKNMMKLVTADHVTGETTQKGMEGWIEVGTIFSGLYQEIEELFDPLAKGPNEKLRQKLAIALGQISEFTAFASAAVKGTAAEVRGTRSKNMLKVANSAVDDGVKGVWKVGERHIGDIGIDQTAKKFQLLTKKEFQDGFTEYYAEILASIGDQGGAKVEEKKAYTNI